MALGIPVYQPRKLRSGDFPQQLTDLQPDLIVVTAYGRILPKDILDLPALGCVNVHASLLPRWRGAAPIQWSIVAGDDETGVCLMVMEEGLDTGPVYAHESTPISPNDTGQTLHDRLSQMGAKVLETHLSGLIDRQLEPTPQQEDKVTLASILSRNDGQIDWNQSAQSIVNHIRGFYPWPGAHSTIEWAEQRKRIKIFPPAVALSQDTPKPPGTLIERSSEGLTVQCGEGAILLTEVQLEDRKRMAVADLL